MGVINIAYSTISYGSSGSDVKKLQETLNNHGYSLAVDGQFGSKTQAAVRDYQKKNGLVVDGIVGTKTWGSLTSKGSASSSSLSSSGVSSKKVSLPKSTPRPEYEKSDAVQSAENELKSWENNKPGEYESKYSEQIESILNDILNREEFNYNLNADPLYQQYREQYIQNGKKAMMDTVGQAAALTGGYANSYAVSAGNQAYDEYLNELNSIALDLRDRAYTLYSDEGDRMLEDITLLRSLDGDDYDKYLGELERYYSDGEFLLDKLVSMSDAEFDAFLAQVDAWENDRDYEFDKYQDALDRQEFEKEMAFKEAEAKRDQANEDRNYALALRKSSSSGSSSSSKSSSDKNNSDSTKAAPVTYKEFCLRTGVTTIMTEKEYNSSSSMQKTFPTYQKYLAKMYKKYGEAS
ncbi:MAG: peptidoglycan-binding protein [Clostridia bacterium]|nr:peptidoglycan-binding protein [Clostridia bacterium]